MNLESQDFSKDMSYTTLKNRGLPGCPKVRHLAVKLWSVQRMLGVLRQQQKAKDEEKSEQRKAQVKEMI